MTRMAKQKLKIGDKIRVIGYRPCKYPPGVVDEMGTEELFKRCVGQTLRVDGFDKYGHVELNVADDGSQAPDYCMNTIWIEPEFVELVL